MRHIDDPDHEFRGSSSKRSVFDGVDAFGQTHVFGAMSTAPTNSLNSPPDRHLVRYEAWDARLKCWVAAGGSVTWQMRKLSDRDRKTFLFVHRFGIRAVEYEGEPDKDDEAVLDGALARGQLDLGHRSYGLSISPTGGIRVRSANGNRTYTREALLDVIRRKTF